jgi:uncharacterized damage-inducible protein DinB
MNPRESDLLRSHFTERFRHDWWANETLLVFLQRRVSGQRTEAHEAGLRRAHHLIGHLLATELMWLGRIEESEDQMQAVWRGRTLPELRSLFDQARSKWREFLVSLDPSDFSRSVGYRNVVGEQYEHTLIQIIAHVLNHSTHHRAQVLALVRELGLEPPGLDYMVYLRLPKGDR